MQESPPRRASDLEAQRRGILAFGNFILLFGSFLFGRSLHITVIAFTVQPAPSSLRNGGSWEEGPLRPPRRAFNVRLSATRRRNGKPQKRPSLSTNHNKSFSTLGFTETTTYSPSIIPADADIRKLLQNLFSVCGHLQNPDLYSPRWADHVEEYYEPTPDGNGNVTLVVRSDILAGTIVTLCPIHALVYKSAVNGGKDDDVLSRGLLTVFDERVDGDFLRSEGRSLSSVYADQNAYKSIIPLKFLQGDSAVEGKALKYKKAALQVHVQANPGRSSGLWKGYRATVVSNKDKNSFSANCMVMSLPGAAPLCGIVSTRDMTRGEEILVNPNVLRNKHLSLLVRKNYAPELAELEGYLKMAYTANIQPDVPEFIDEENENTAVKVTTSSSRAQDQHTVQDPKPSFQSPFHEIDLHFPGIRHIHRDPDILVIDDFLSKEECESIMKHAEPHLIPCLIKHPQTGQVMQDPSRTSTNANLPQADVPDIVKRLVRLTRCTNASYLETLQVLCYSDGQKFEPHTDGFDGPTTACGFHQSGRLVTVFCYLNTVPTGGSTVFTQLGAGRDGEEGLTIQPRQGMAVVHFPATTGLEEDTRTEHEGSETIHHKKWLLTTWMWKDPRSDPLYDESIFPSLIKADMKKKHEDL